MCPITYRIITEHAGSILDLFEKGLSFQWIVESGCWPPLRTLNDFLHCGCDDGPGGVVLTWRAFALTDREYRQVQRRFRAQGRRVRVWRFGLRSATYQQWFAALGHHQSHGRARPRAFAAS
jgi:hypothetical protein